jgi:outer membrane protein OmpA-like peptidoglycan-associated protein
LKGVIRAPLRRVLAGLALSLVAVSPALAQGEPLELPRWYVGPFLGYAIPDADRNAKGGLNLQLIAGKVLAESVAIEAVIFSNQFGADGAASADADLLGAGVDLALGTPDLGYPVFSLGAGAVQHDIGGESKTEPYGNLALGYYLPFTLGGELWRIEARYHAILTDHPALPADDMVEDVRLSLGVLFAFGREQPPQARQRAPEPAPTAEPAAEPVVPAATAFADEDSDGVADADDRCPSTIANAQVDAKGCVLPEKVVLGQVDFGSSSASMTADGYNLLRSVAAAMKANPAMKLEVGGHADASGDPQSNLRLSAARARAAHDFIVSLGIDHRRLTVKGYGDSQPLNDNSTQELRAYNRRVQFRRLDQP